MLSTWVELALVFQIPTGIRQALEFLDLKSQEIVFRSIVKRIWSRSEFKLEGLTEVIKYVWRPVPSSSSCKPRIDYSMQEAHNQQ